MMEERCRAITRRYCLGWVRSQGSRVFDVVSDALCIAERYGHAAPGEQTVSRRRTMLPMLPG